MITDLQLILLMFNRAFVYPHLMTPFGLKPSE